MTVHSKPSSTSSILRRGLMRVTDYGMLLYWAVTVLMALGWLSIPAEWLFKNYHDPHVVAWNWSFFPLDLALALTGLRALTLEKSGDGRWRGWAIISLTLTVCAGGMAIAYWAFAREFALSWWAANLFLMLWPLPFLWRLLETRDPA